MKQKAILKHKEKPLFTALAVGLGVGLLIQVLGSMVIAILVSKELVSLDAVGKLTPMVHVLAGLVGAWITGGNKGDKLLQTSLVYCVLQAMLTCVIGWILHGSIGSLWLYHLIALTVGGGLAVALRLAPGKKNPYRKMYHG